MGPDPLRLGPYKKRRLGHRGTQRADHVGTQGGDGRPHTKDRGLRRKQPCPHLHLGLLVSRFCEKMDFHCVSCLVCDFVVAASTHQYTQLRELSDPRSLQDWGN